jgi:hypothetical protein
MNCNVCRVAKLRTLRVEVVTFHIVFSILFCVLIKKNAMLNQNIL